MAKKRILIIDGPLGGGGAERVLIDILRNINYEHYEVDLALICAGGVLIDEIPPQVRIIPLWKGYTISYKLALRLSLWLRCNYLLSRRINSSKLRRDYDLEISFLEGMPLKLGSLRTTKARKVTWIHADISIDSYEASQFYPGEESICYDKMDVVVNVSKDCENGFVRRFPECKAEKRVIYNPIDRRKIKLMGSCDPKLYKKNELTIVTVGRLTQQKNPKRFLDVATLCRDRGLPVRFKWIGDGALRSEMEDLCEKRGLSDIVEFTGFLKNPFPLIQAADIMMVTSDFEGFCLVICEAMCLGVPVISTRTSGPSEIIGQNEYGILTGSSPEELFIALKYLVDNPEERRAIANKAIRRPDDYSIEKTLQDIDRLF